MILWLPPVSVIVGAEDALTLYKVAPDNDVDYAKLTFLISFIFLYCRIDVPGLICEPQSAIIPTLKVFVGTFSPAAKSQSLSAREPYAVRRWTSVMNPLRLSCMTSGEVQGSCQ